MFGNPRMLTAFTVAVLATVGVIAALATSSWWVLPIALLGHAVASVLVLGTIGKSLKSQDKPDPLTEARVEAEETGEAAGEGDGGGPRMAI